MSRTYSFTTSAEHGTVYNGSFDGGTFYSGHSSPPNPSPGDSPPEERRSDHTRQHTDGAVATFRFDTNPSTATSAPTSGHHSEGSLETDTQHEHQCRAEPYSPGVAVNRDDFTAMHGMYGAGYPQNHAIHARQVERPPLFRRSETDPGTYFPDSSATYYALHPPVNPGYDRRLYCQPAGQPIYHTQPQFNVQPHPQHHGYTPSPAQYYASYKPQPHHATTMPNAQHYGPDHWPAAGPPVSPQPDSWGSMALDGSGMPYVPSYTYAPTPVLTPTRSTASSERSSGPSTPRVFMPYPSIPGKQPCWVTDVPDGLQPIAFQEARRY